MTLGSTAITVDVIPRKSNVDTLHNLPIYSSGSTTQTPNICPTEDEGVFQE